MLNFAGCAQCGENSQVNIVNKQKSDDDEEEAVTYQREYSL